MVAGLVVHPLAAARDVLAFHREYMKTMPDEFTCWFVMRQAPPLPAIPAEYHGKEILVLALCCSGAVNDGERLTKPLRQFGRPVADMVGVVPYTEWQKVLDPLLAPGARNYWKTNEFVEVTDGLVDVLTDYARRLPDPQTEIACAQLGRAVGRVPADRTAYGHRDAQYVMNVHGRWADPANDQACIGWARDLFRATIPFATGSLYVNFLTEDDREKVKAAYGGNYARLAALKQRYDPGNLFHMNHNIQPAG